MNVQSFLTTARKTVAQWIYPQPPQVSPFKDSTQISVNAKIDLRPSMFYGGGSLVANIKKEFESKTLNFESQKEANQVLLDYTDKGWTLLGIAPEERLALPQMQGVTRVYKSFKPQKCIVTELVTSTFSGEGLPDLVLQTMVSDASDLVMVHAFCGADNCFPSAPSEHNGISCAVFASSSLGNGIQWPVVNGGIDMTIGLAIEPSVLFRAPGNCSSCGHGEHPKGYDLLPSKITVKARVNFLG